MIRLRHGSAREAAHNFFDVCRSQIKQAGLDPDNTFFIFPTGGFGEFTFICSLLPELRKLAPVALFLPENKMDFVLMFPHSADYVVQYSLMFADYIPELYNLSIRKPGHPFVPFTDWFGDGRFNVELVTHEGRLTLKESYAYALALPLNTAGVRATIPAGEMLAGLEAPGKRVLIIPHANTHKHFPAAMWDHVAAQFIGAGYEVLFDTFNYPHPTPAGVQALSLKLPELLRNLPAFDLVVALRSGLADLLGTVSPADRGKVAILYYVTDRPPVEELRYNHARGVARSGLALSRIFPGDATLRDIEIGGDQLDPAEIAQIFAFAQEGAQ
jgi:hypothetical protein